MGDVPVLDSVPDVGHKPSDQDDHQNSGHNLSRPLDDLSVPPDRYAFVGEPADRHNYDCLPDIRLILSPKHVRLVDFPQPASTT